MKQEPAPGRRRGGRQLRPRVLIVHARGEWTGLPRLPKLIRAAGAAISVFAPPGTKLWMAGYVDERFAAPREPGAWSAALRAHMAVHRDRYDWVLVGDENAVVELALHEDPNWLAGWFPVDALSPVRRMVISKAEFTTAAMRAGVPVPESHICTSRAQAEAAAAELGYPVMLKAAHSYAGVGVRRANSQADLDRWFNVLADRLPLVVQRYEVGRVGSTQVFFDHGRLAGWASSYKLACFPEPFGPSSARELMVHPDMHETLAGIGRLTGFHGLCGVDWLHRASDGKLLVLEFNPRPAPVIHLGPLSGVDFTGAIRDMLAGRVAARPPADVGPRRIYLFPQHLTRCIEMRRWRDLAWWLPGRAAHDVPWDQPRLLLSHLATLARRLSRAVAADVGKAWRRVAERGTTQKPVARPHRATGMATPVASAPASAIS